MTNPDNVGWLPEFVAVGEFVGYGRVTGEPHVRMSSGLRPGVRLFTEDQMRAYGELCRAAPAGGDDWAFEGRDWMRPKRDQVPARDSLCQQLQQKCSDWGTYWRAPDAHGVELTVEQALELLRDALGVEVDIKDSAPAGSGEVEDWMVELFDEVYEREWNRAADEADDRHKTIIGPADRHATREAIAALLRKLQQGAE